MKRSAEGDDDYWTGLFAFVRTAESRSFTAAAHALGLSPSAVGRAVTRLEARLGVTLVKRSTRALSLTPEGEAFLRHVVPALDALREAEHAIGSDRPVDGIVRVTAPVDVGRLLLASWADGLRDEHPDLVLELSITDRLIDLRREGVDIAVRVGSPPPAAVTSEAAGTLGYAVVAAPAYLVDRAAPRTASDLASHDCLQYLTNEGSLLPWRIDGETVATAGPFATDDGGALLQAVLSGAGIAYMLDLAVRPAIDDGRLTELFADAHKPSLTVSLAHPFGAHVPRRVRAVLDFLRTRLPRGANRRGLESPDEHADGRGGRR